MRTCGERRYKLLVQPFALVMLWALACDDDTTSGSDDAATDAPADITADAPDDAPAEVGDTPVDTISDAADTPTDDGSPATGIRQIGAVVAGAATAQGDRYVVRSLLGCGVSCAEAVGTRFSVRPFQGGAL